MRENTYAVWLQDQHVGLLHQRGDHTRFTFDTAYRDDPDRPVLGLYFEETMLAPQSAALRLPPWFSNLLPEGRLREWVAEDRGVSVDREMELLAHLGHDLPGAVRVRPAHLVPAEAGWSEPSPSSDGQQPDVAEGNHPGWRISLAGVQLKFAALARDHRLTVPGFGEGSDWIVKLPDHQFENLPRNEFAMMTWARAAGIDVPEIRLVHRDELAGLPPKVWPGHEQWAYAVRRFDRGDHRYRIHIEDLAQVRNVYPRDKYRGNFETVAALIYRNRDLAALREFARRLAFVVLIGNGDAHVKNWSLIYRDPRVPSLAPAYDLVSTAMYRAGTGEEDLGLKFGGSRRFEQVNLTLFSRLEARLGATGADLADAVADTVTRSIDGWPACADLLGEMPELREGLRERLDTFGRSLLRSG